MVALEVMVAGAAEILKECGAHVLLDHQGQLREETPVVMGQPSKRSGMMAWGLPERHRRAPAFHSACS